MFVGVVVENFHKCKEALEKVTHPTLKAAYMDLKDRTTILILLQEMREKAREKRLQRKLKRQKYEESVAGKKKKGM